MPIDFTVLATEIQTDPSGRGYGPHVASGNDNAIVDLLNEILGTISIQRSTLSRQEIFEATAIADFKGLTNRDVLMYQIVMSMGNNGGGIPVGPGTNARAILSGLFPNPSSTRTNLIALVMRKGSRAEELFGENITITASQIALALRG